MSVLNSLARAATKPFPSVISQRTHSFLDYFIVGSFLAGTGLFWKQNKRAALASLLSAGAELAVILLTDYPGGLKKTISLRGHRNIDFGLATMIATMPEFLAFSDESEKKFFLAQGVLITAINELTKYPKAPQRVEKGTSRTTAA